MEYIMVLFPLLLIAAGGSKTFLILAAVLFVLCFFALLSMRKKKREIRFFFDKRLFPLCVAFSAFLAVDRYFNRADIIELLKPLFDGENADSRFAFLVAILAVFAAFGFNCMVMCFRDYVSEKKPGFYKNIGKYSVLAFVFVLQCFHADYSSLGNVALLMPDKALYFIISFSLIAFFNILLYIIVRKWKISLLISGFVVFLWSLANYYVIKFHGAPLLPQELRNLKTAFGVMGGYTYGIDYTVINTALLFGAEIYAALAFDIDKVPVKRKLRLSLLFLGISAAVSCLAFSPLTGNGFMWSWKNSVDSFGFVLYAAKDFSFMVNPYVTPSGYSSKKIGTDGIASVASFNLADEDLPDIFFILNETFCDLNDYADINADADCFADFYGIENAIYGKAAYPAAYGGGTNDSEFEFLTSHSTNLLKGTAPFNFINFKKSNDSAVKYLKGMGYSTAVMHCCRADNYKRNIAYPSLGFDRVILGGENFKCRKNFNRYWLDEDNFDDMLTDYNEHIGAPQFHYLLTYQNHGGYKQNDDNDDTVHTQNDFGSVTSELNEFLSSVKLSGEAFKKLTDRLSECERPVIVCMVGDHAPSFISDIEPREFESEYERIAARHMVPYVIWSNKLELNAPQFEYATMTDLFPLVLRSASMPLSHYYSSILELHDEVPVRVVNEIYMDKNGEFDKFSEGNRYFEMLQKYYYMEYNALKAGKDYKSEMFLPIK